MPTRGEALEGAELQFEYPQRIQYWVVAELGYQAIDINLEVSPPSSPLPGRKVLPTSRSAQKTFVQRWPIESIS